MRYINVLLNEHQNSVNYEKDVRISKFIKPIKLHSLVSLSASNVNFRVIVVVVDRVESVLEFFCSAPRTRSDVSIVGSSVTAW